METNSSRVASEVIYYEESRDQTLVALNLLTGKAFYCNNGVWSRGMDPGTRTCTVTQATSKSTGVICQGLAGTITMNAAGLATVTSVAFTVTDAAVAAGDTIMVSIKSGATANSYNVGVDAVAAGTFNISLRNYTGGTLFYSNPLLQLTGFLNTSGHLEVRRRANMNQAENVSSGVDVEHVMTRSVTARSAPRS